MKPIDFAYLDRLNSDEEELLHKLGYKPNYTYLTKLTQTLFYTNHTINLSSYNRTMCHTWNAAILIHKLLLRGAKL